MNKKVYLIPLALLFSLAFLTWSCEAEETEDYCESFDLVAKTQCGPATLCCPTDGGNCYLLNPSDGSKIYCNKEDCTQAENSYIDKYCSKGLSDSEVQFVKAELQQHFQKLMKEARMYSVCL